MQNLNRASSKGRWPTGTEYAESVQQPRTSFGDPELTAGRLTLTPLGLPAMASGQNAVAFHFETQERTVAVRCLLSAQDEGRERYHALRSHVETQSVPSVVAASWLDEGIRVHDVWWPVVVMPWAPGRPLHDAVETRLDDPGRMVRLTDRWLDLVETMQAKGFAHGDLQHGNILLTEHDEFNLVDLDGVWVPEMTVGAPDEYGHPNYQHPNRTADDWGPTVDTFSALAIATSMAAIAADPDVSRFMMGENLLFTKNDLVAPGRTDVWRELGQSTDPTVVDLVNRLLEHATAERPPTVTLTDALALDLTVVRPDVVAPPGPALPSTVEPAAGDWWNQGASVVADSHWAVPDEEPAVEQTDSEAPVVATESSAQRGSGLAGITGRPVAAGLASGIAAGLIGSLFAAAMQAAIGDNILDAVLFIVCIASLLGGFINAWPALNLAAYGSAARRFLVGALVGCAAGLLGVALGDVLIKAAVGRTETENAAVVAYAWALVAALVGLAVGALRSPRAAAIGFASGGVAGVIGGALHGGTVARFSGRRLIVDAADPAMVAIATAVAALIAIAIAFGVRSVRRGSLSVTDGPGQGSVIDIHKAHATIGGSSGDDLVIVGKDLPAKAVRLELTDEGFRAQADVPVVLDGRPVSDSFLVTSGQVLAVAGVFIRADLRSHEPTG